MLINKQNKSPLRKIYGQTLVSLGEVNSNIVVLDADTSCSTQTKIFADRFPERFFNMGISEQDAMSTAAGLSAGGKIPFVSMFAMFATGRAWDQIRNSIAYPKFNVKIVATHGGITVGEDGATHQALEDISIMRSIPNMTVIIPADKTETEAAIRFAAEHKGPVYIRLNRSDVVDLFDKESYSFDFPKARILKEGNDVSILANGETLCEALECAELLKSQNIEAEVISVPVVKPLDEDTIIKSAMKTKAVVVVENHSIIGGLGSAVSECLSEKYPVLVKRIGINDEFGQSGKSDELFVKYGLTAQGFIGNVLKLVDRKKNKND